MKTLFLVLAITLATTAIARADSFGVFNDDTGSSCYFNPGFNDHIVVIEKFCLGTVGCKFKISLPPGSSFIAFNTPYATTGSIPDGISVSYGECLSGPNVVVGNIVANLEFGRIDVGGIEEFTPPSHTDCSLVELTNDIGWQGWVGTEGFCPTVTATEPSTWGKVKSLYR